ncbi:hypothetical protein BT69DRAFT_1329893 [Atractiella rhizophila]|nr:hypothetical protein BT69DRAFT_1329893 [Atractiella rhizophila]
MSALSSNIFDPPVVKALCKQVLETHTRQKAGNKKGNWLVDWETMWTSQSVNDTVEKWKKNKSIVGEEGQLFFAAQVLEYRKIVNRVLDREINQGAIPTCFPLYGPLFIPPTADYDHLRRRNVSDCPEKFLVEPLLVLTPEYFPGYNMEKCPVKGCMAKVEKQGLAPTGYRSVYGLSCNLKAIGCSLKCQTHGKWSTTSPNFWRNFQPYELDGIPYFRESSAVTRELFNFITELRPKTDVGKLGEAIQQLHSEHVQQIKRVWQQYAIEEQIRHKWPSGPFKPILKQLPAVLSRAADPTIKADAINPSPSSDLIKTIYEHWIECLSLGLDATLKVAKKANIYTTVKETGGRQKVQVTNIFGGGLLTMVNEDRELVGYEFLVGNSPLEMGPPLQDFAQRARLLGVDFEGSGQACVDLCCQHRNSILLYVPELWIGQDLAHLEMRVFETIPHINPARADFVVAFRDAILKKKADLHGEVAEYYSVEESLERLTKVEDKFKKNPDLWNKCCATFELQKGHIAKGCLIPKHQQLPFTTSNNENWHNAAGEPFRGSASSLTTVLSVLPDIFLRKNLLAKIKNRSQPADSPSRAFRKKVIEAGTHHIFLVDRNLRLEEILYSSSQPKLLDVSSKHEFG